MYILFAIGEGAFAVYLEPWHADIFEFLELRKNHGKVPSLDHSLSLHINLEFVSYTLTLHFFYFYFRKNTGLETCFMVFGYQIFSWKGSRAMGSGHSFVLMKLQVWQIVGVQILRDFTLSMRTR